MKFEFKNDRQEIIFVIIFIVIIIIAGIGGLIHYSRLDNDLKDKQQFETVQADFENEFKKIENPSRTAVNKFEKTGKVGVGESITTRYRTELSQEDFQGNLRKQLEKLGWIFYGEDNSPDYGGQRLKFCKGKFDATLSLETRTIWNDGADYYRLSLSFGYRDSILNGGKLPASCY